MKKKTINESKTHELCEDVYIVNNTHTQLIAAKKKIRSHRISRREFICDLQHLIYSIFHLKMLISK